MQKTQTNLPAGRQVFFPKPSGKIFKGFGPAFLVIALGIGSGEFILWPYLSAHHGFGILWGALLGITIQLVIIVAVEKNTAFLGENILVSFRRIFKYSFFWILFSTIIGFGWPGFSAMSSSLIVEGFSFSQDIHQYISLVILVLAAAVLLIGKNSYKNILNLQKVNMILLLSLVIFLFIYYFDVGTFFNMTQGFFGIGDSYVFIPVGLSLLTFMGAIAYAGSGGNLLLINSFYVEKEQKGLVGKKEFETELIEADNDIESLKNTKQFVRESWKQNTLFFWGTGLFIIVILSYVSYSVLYGNPGLPDNFSFLVLEAEIFRNDIHPFVGNLFIISGAIALFGVQLGIFDFIGRISKTIKKYSRYSHISDVLAYRIGVLTITIFGAVILVAGFSAPILLIIIGATINAFSMGVIALLLYRVEKKLLPKYIQSKSFKMILVFTAIFYFTFFTYVLIEKFLLAT